MNAPSDEHPSRQELAAFGVGKLDDHDHERVEFHIERCDSCCKYLQSLPGDTVVRLLGMADEDTSVMARGDPGVRIDDRSHRKDTGWQLFAFE